MVIVQKLHELLENVILDRGPQFAVELTKGLKKCWGLKQSYQHSFIHKQIDRLNE